MFDLSEATFKKYYLELEKEGYNFQRDGRTLLFTDDDVITFEKFVELIQYDGMTIPLVAKKLAEMKGYNVTTEEKRSYDVMTLVEKAVSSALKAQEEKFHDVITTVMNQNNELKEQMKRLEEKHEKLLMQSIQEAQETKKEIQDIKEEQQLSRKNSSYQGRLLKRGIE